MIFGGIGRIISEEAVALLLVWGWFFAVGILSASLILKGEREEEPGVCRRSEGAAAIAPCPGTVCLWRFAPVVLSLPVVLRCWSSAWRIAACRKPMWDQFGKDSLPWQGCHVEQRQRVTGKEWQRQSATSWSEPTFLVLLHYLGKESRRGWMEKKCLVCFSLLVIDNKLH